MLILPPSLIFYNRPGSKLDLLKNAPDGVLALTVWFAVMADLMIAGLSYQILFKDHAPIGLVIMVWVVDVLVAMINAFWIFGMAQDILKKIKLARVKTQNDNP